MFCEDGNGGYCCLVISSDSCNHVLACSKCVSLHDAFLEKALCHLPCAVLLLTIHWWLVLLLYCIEYAFMLSSLQLFACIVLFCSSSCAGLDFYCILYMLEIQLRSKCVCILTMVTPSQHAICIARCCQLQVVCARGVVWYGSAMFRQDRDPYP